MPPEARFDRSALAAVLDRQYGVVTRAQALAVHMSSTAVQYRIREGGAWRVLLPGVYLTHGGRATDDQRDIAALLYGGPASVVTGPAALRRHGFRAMQAVTVDVLVPPGTQRRDAAFARLHRTTRMPDMHCYAGPVRYALVPRATVDTARGLPR